MVDSRAICKVYSYIGTGFYGEDNPTGLEFDFEPSVVLALFGGSHTLANPDTFVSAVVIDELDTEYKNWVGFYSNSMFFAKKSDDGKSISWYYSGSSEPEQRQFNVDGATYYFLAISKSIEDYYVEHKIDTEKITASVIEKTNSLYANVLKGTVTLNKIAPLSFTDVSPLPHTVDVRITDEIFEYDPITVWRWGKNLCPSDTAQVKKLEWTSSSGSAVTRYGYELRLPPGTYTMHAVDTTGKKGSTYLYGVVCNEYDGIAVSACHLIVGATYNTQTVTLGESDYIMLYYGPEVGTLADAQQIFSRYVAQVEVGSAKTEYVPYIEPTTYTVQLEYLLNEETGEYAYTMTGDTIPSLSPNMTLFPGWYHDDLGVWDSLPVEITYNRDTNKVIEQLTNAIISLGGNV